MPSRRRAAWTALTDTLWFIPLCGIAAGVALALAVVSMDRLGISGTWGELYWLLVVQADGARQILATIAGSMITVISLVGSLTLLAMTLAASQLGPRLLQLFAADRLTQVVIGQFIGTFVYAIVVLRAVSSRDGGAFVPHLSILVALVVVLVSLVLLIYFIHHLATFMQADSVLAALSKQLTKSIRAVFPADPPRAAAHPADPPETAAEHTIPAPATGYVQRVDVPALIALARRFGGHIEVARAPGDFAVAGTPLATLHAPSAPAGGVIRRVREAIQLGPKRTALQDVPFAANSLVEIALRALSPSINDHRTPCAALDLLGAALIEVLHRGDPPTVLCDAEGAPRVRMGQPSFATLAEIAFADIRTCAAGRPSVLQRLTDTLALVAGHAGSAPERRVLRTHARAVALVARRSVEEPSARRQLAASLQAVKRKLATTSGSAHGDDRTP